MELNFGETMPVPALSAAETILKMKQESENYAFIDVRSEGEWLKAASPGFRNRPLLTNEERHLVGKEYKAKGQAKAIELGEKLVSPLLADRIQDWLTLAGHKKAVVCCWRGGMRSNLVANWLRERGLETYTVAGGYKALRNHYLDVLEVERDFVVLSGLTGVNKTGLLNACTVDKVDLELLAKHRGSSFGSFMDESQPAQVTFENELAFQLMLMEQKILLEDESAHIGRIRLPDAIRKKMASASTVILEATMDERVRHIIEEYIQQPMASGVEWDRLRAFTLKHLNRIERRLGGKRKSEIQSMMMDAFEGRAEHCQWIALLLEVYYDPMYRYGLERYNRPVLFKGDFAACKQWIQKNLSG